MDSIPSTPPLIDLGLRTALADAWPYIALSQDLQFFALAGAVAVTLLFGVAVYLDAPRWMCLGIDGLYLCCAIPAAVAVSCDVRVARILQGAAPPGLLYDTLESVD